MKLIVLSDIQLDQDTENKIRGIFKEASCPNEALKNTFANVVFEPRANRLILNDGTVETVLNVEVKED